MNLRDKRRVFLALEQLEDRMVPAVVFVQGILSITNPGNLPGNVVLTQTANNMFTVTSPAGSLGPVGPVSNLLIDSGNGNHNTTIALGGFTYTGSLTDNQHNGNDSVTINNGSILGNTTIVTQNGNDTVAIGSSASVTFGGNVSLVNTAGVESVSLAAGGNIKIGGSLGITSAATVLQGADSLTVGGSTSIQDFPVTGGNSSVSLGGAGFTTGSLFITGGPGADSVALSTTTVNGSTAITSGQGNDTLNIGLTGGLNSFFGTFTYTGGSGTDSVSVGTAAGQTTSFFGSTTSFNLGAGNDTMTLNWVNSFSNNTSILNAGNASITLTTNANVFGPLTFNQAGVNGNGNDTISIVNPPSGTIFLFGGNGNDSITFAPTGTGTFWNINFRVGSGINTLNLAGSDTAPTLSGSTFSPFPSGGNSILFTNAAWTISNFFNDSW